MILLVKKSGIPCPCLFPTFGPIPLSNCYWNHSVVVWLTASLLLVKTLVILLLQSCAVARIVAIHMYTQFNRFNPIKSHGSAMVKQWCKNGHHPMKSMKSITKNPLNNPTVKAIKIHCIPLTLVVYTIIIYIYIKISIYIYIKISKYIYIISSLYPYWFVNVCYRALFLLVKSLNPKYNQQPTRTGIYWDAMGYNKSHFRSPNPSYLMKQ